MGGHDVALPESVTVQLKNGDLLVEEATVIPDGNGEWHYHFTALSTTQGAEIAYTIGRRRCITLFPPMMDTTSKIPIFRPWRRPSLIEKVVEGEKAPETQFSFLLKGENGVHAGGQ
ncbi:MAG: Cna B-type domain-containing protein [Faecalispora jeddahensis]